jgi:hypothetical protein
MLFPRCRPSCVFVQTEWHDQKHRTEIVEHARPPHGDQPGRPAVTRQVRETNNNLVGTVCAYACDRAQWNSMLISFCCVFAVCFPFPCVVQIPVMHRHRGKKTFFSQNMRIYSQSTQIAIGQKGARFVAVLLVPIPHLSVCFCSFLFAFLC